MFPYSAYGVELHYCARKEGAVFVSLKNYSVGIACAFSFIAVVLRGASVISEGEHFVKIAGALLLFLIVFLLYFSFRRFLKRLFNRSPLLFCMLFFTLLTFANFFYASSVLPRIEKNTFSFFAIQRLPDNSLFSMMENRGGNASLLYAFLRKEARGKTVFLPVQSPSVDKRLLQSLSAVSDTQEYDQAPDVFIASLGLKWSTYKDPMHDVGFEYARYGDDMILGRVGALSCR